MRHFLGTIAAVLASLTIPIVILVLAVFPEPPADEGDAYIRGAIGLAGFIPVLAVIFLIYHVLSVIALRLLPEKPIPILLALSVMVSATVSALLLAPGAPLSWSSLGPFAAISASLWAMLALGSAVLYFAFFTEQVRNKQNN